MITINIYHTYQQILKQKESQLCLASCGAILGLLSLRLTWSRQLQLLQSMHSHWTYMEFISISQFHPSDESNAHLNTSSLNCSGSKIACRSTTKAGGNP